MRFFADRNIRLAAAGWLVAAALAAAPAVAQAGDAGQNELGERVFERFEVRDLDESILLRPRAAGAKVRSIEITEDDELLVDGRDADRSELDELLGADAGVVAELLALEAAARRETLGFWSDRAVRRRAPRAPAHVEVDVPVGGGHIKVRGSRARGDRVSVGRSIKIGEGERVGEAVCIGCSIEIEGEIADGAVAVGGSVRVAGTVGGDVVAVGGSVVVEDGGLVEGEGVSVGGTTVTRGSGRIEGEVVSVGIGGPWLGGWSGGWAFPWSAFSDFGRLISALVRTGVLALLAVLAVLVMRPGVEVAAARIANEPWKAAFAGLLAQLLFLPVLVLVVVVLAVSIIGIPLLVLVPFAMLALVVANFLGFVGVARVLGGGAERQLNWSASSVALSVVVGVVLIQALSLVGRALSLPGGWLAVLGFTIVGLGFFVKYVVWTMGLGAMTLAALSGDWRRPREASAAPPPPPPPAVEPAESHEQPLAPPDEPERI